MVADFERAIKYPFNLKPLFILGILVLIPFLLFLPMSLIDTQSSEEMTSGETMFLAGGFISFMGLFFVVFVLLYGYLVRTSKSMIAGDLDLAPVLSDIKGLFIDGLKLMVLQVYLESSSYFII
jgi:hypothetical protein